MSVPRLPLVVTADADLLDDLLRLAAAGGSEVDVAADPAAARPRLRRRPARRDRRSTSSSRACGPGCPRRSRVIVAARDEAAGADLGDRQAARRRARGRRCRWPSRGWSTGSPSGSTRPPGGRILAVIGGRGGAGASILAGGLAVTAVRAGHRTLLVDADPLGGGLDLLLGWEDVDGLRWPALAGADGRVDPPALLRALPHRGDLVLLSFDRERAAVACRARRWRRPSTRAAAAAT